jgi:electron transfer flavoprotein alpha subunit
MTVLVLVEHDRGEVTEATWEGLTAARHLAAAIGADLEAVVPGASGSGLADKAAAHGADVVHVADHDLLADYGPDAWAETVRQLMVEVEPAAVVGVGTDRGNEVLAHVAARLDLPFVANCLSVLDDGADADNQADDDVWAVTRVQWGGSLLEDATIEADCKILSFAHHAVAPEPADAPALGRVETFEPTLGPAEAVTLIRDRAVESQGVTLATSPVVVSGGRGVGSECDHRRRSAHTIMTSKTMVKLTAAIGSAMVTIRRPRPGTTHRTAVR